MQNQDECMLIDAGNNPDGKYISKYLRKELNIKKIDYLICTHAHEDHAGGIDIIIEDFEIGKFFMPKKSTTTKTFIDILNAAEKKDLKMVSPEVGTKFNVGLAECEVMTKNDDAEELNETSIVIEMSFGNQKYLFTGDMEVANEESRTWNDVDVLKVAHHGSVYTTTEKFLKQVKPEIAIITCGKNNDYYYPHEKVLKRLKEIGCNEIYVTSEQGTILIMSNGLENKINFLKKSFDGNLEEK
ncbi:MAG: MBL fold metallo-hydrolase [Clostridia bacterium]|nr:MBL fold metallo-hydrolase [Clostridia bacterium]